MIALSLMAFVLLLILSISTLVQVEMASSESAVARLEAEQSALLSLNVAIGRLQETAGLDQRVTAPAEAAGRTEVGAKQLTGVWRSWEGRDHQANGVPIAPNYVSKRVEGDLDMNSTNDGRFLAWLVSSNFDPSITADVKYANPPSLEEVEGETVPLLGAGTVGQDAEGIANQVHVKASTFDDEQAGYAWWISGENTKSLLKPIEDPTGPFGWSERFASSTRPDATVYSITDQSDLEKVSSRRSLNQISHDLTLDVAQGESFSGKFYHDLTTYGRGLLTNTATGGWRRDLSLLSEQWKRTDFSTSNLPFFTLQPGVETSAGKASVNTAGSAGNLIYPWAIESDFTVNGGASNNTESGAASVGWDALVDFALQYRNVNSIDASGRIHMPLEEINPRDAIPRRPVLARVHWVFSYMSRGNENSAVVDPVTGETTYGIYRAYIVASPVVTFWNPYNVAIPGYDKFTVRFTDPVIPVKFKFKVGDEEQDAFYGINKLARNNQIKFIVSGDTTEWAPGESRVYSATSVEGSGGPSEVDAHEIDLDLGYRTTGGARYALFKGYEKNGDGEWVAKSGSKLTGAPDDVVTVTAEMEDGTAFKIEILPKKGTDTAKMDILYTVPKITSDLYYDELKIVNDGNVTLRDVEEGVSFSERFLVAVMQLRNLNVKSTTSKGYAQTKPNLFFSSNPYSDHELLDAYPYDWNFFTELNSADVLPEAGGDDADSGYVGTSFRSNEGLERLVCVVHLT